MEKKPRNLRKIILKSLLWAVCGLALLLIAATAGGMELVSAGLHQ